MSEREFYLPTDRVHAFSNGTEHHMWLEINCQRGEKGCRKYNPTPTSRHGCPIEVEIAKAACLDGTIRASIALRGGLLEPGPNGRLVQPEGLPPYLCPEYKGYDEPDDRQRRGPRPPAEQMDLLDPRHVPDRPRITA